MEIKCPRLQISCGRLTRVQLFIDTDQKDEDPVARYNSYKMLSLVAPVFTEHFMPK